MTDNYSNVNSFIIILADKRDPEISWANHLARGSAGGCDCVAPLGTPVYAPADCVVSFIPNNGSGGNTATMTFGDGWRDQFMHLSRFGPGGVTRKGQLVGYSGDSGAPGQPHVHWHRIDPQGRRQNPWHYFTSTAGGGNTPIDNTPAAVKDDDLMIRIQATNRGIGLIGAGYFRILTSTEEVEQSGPLMSAHYTGNDRQFDLWVSMALTGRGASSDLDGAINTKADQQIALLNAINAKPSGGGGGGSASAFDITLSGKAVPHV